MASKRIKEYSYVICFMMLILSFFTLFNNVFARISICVVGVLALFTTYFFHNRGERSLWSTPMIAYTLMITSAILCFGSNFVGHPKENTRLLYIGMLYCLLFLPSFYFIFRKKSAHGFVIIGKCAICLSILFVLSVTWVARSNALLDFTPQRIVNAQIISLKHQSNRIGNYYSIQVALEEVPSEKDIVNLPITGLQASQLHEGNSIKLSIGTGLWGIEHYTLQLE